MEFLKTYPNNNQVYYLTPELPNFEDFYLKVRELEGRVYTDDFVVNLPYVPPGHEQKKEWIIRQKTTQNFLNYYKKLDLQNVLDLGCGNGWFSSMLVTNNTAEILAMDVNKAELEQAARLNQNKNLNYVYADLFHPDLPSMQFDLIVLNSCAQYFPDSKLLIQRLMKMLSKNGTIHFLDSPVYEQSELAAAKARTVQYYEAKGVPQMAAHYHHLCWKDFTSFNTEILYDPRGTWTRLKRKFDRSISPFPWLKFSKKKTNQ